MMIYIPALILLAATVTFLIRAEFATDRHTIYKIKPVASAILVVILGLSLYRAEQGNTVYGLAMLSGLLLCFGGDMALMFQSPKAFRLGLALFLLGHVAYSVVLTVFSGFVPADAVTGALLLSAATAIYLYLKPGLGGMRLPVALYILIISFMVNRAASTLFGGHFSAAQAWCIVGGSVLFYVSDVILAIARFRTPWRYNRISLAFYYSGQALLAMSAGM